MALFALYLNVRSWHETDTYFVGLILTALFLLAAFNRWKSFLANGSLAGSVLGYLCAFAFDDTYRYRGRMSYIEAGLFFGFVIGCIAKFIKTIPESHSDQKPVLIEGQPATGSNSPLLWSSALAISGLSVGLTFAVLSHATDRAAIVAITLSTVAGGVFGVVMERIRKQSPWVQATLELWIVTTLAAGAGAIFGWKILLPILLFDLNLPFTSKEIFSWTTYSCATAGAVIGLIAWTIIFFQKRRARTPHELPN